MIIECLLYMLELLCVYLHTYIAIALLHLVLQSHASYLCSYVCDYYTIIICDWVCENQPSECNNRQFVRLCSTITYELFILTQ